MHAFVFVCVSEWPRKLCCVSLILFPQLISLTSRCLLLSTLSAPVRSNSSPGNNMVSWSFHLHITEAKGHRLLCYLSVSLHLFALFILDLLVLGKEVKKHPTLHMSRSLDTSHTDTLTCFYVFLSDWLSVLMLSWLIFDILTQTKSWKHCMLLCLSNMPISMCLNLGWKHLTIIHQWLTLVMILLFNVLNSAMTGSLRIEKYGQKQPG